MRKRMKVSKDKNKEKDGIRIKRQRYKRIKIRKN